MQYAHEIMSMIRNHGNFKILYIVRHQIAGNMEKFIEAFYAADTAPWQHLVNKTQYLLKSPREIAFILTTNNSPQEILKHPGTPSEHIECEVMKNIKNDIRNKFNPKHGKTRTEEHVIHGSDYPEQVDHVLKLLGLNAKEKYLKSEVKPDGKRMQIPLEKITGNIIGKGIVPLKLTPHYTFTNDTMAKDYQNYWELWWGKKLRYDHSPEAYRNFIKKYQHNEFPVIALEEKKNYRILDGLHRAAIALSKGETMIDGFVREIPGSERKLH